MKNKAFNLQLFAEPSEPKPAEPPAEPTEPKEPTEPTGEKKYTDDDVDKILNKKFAKWQAQQDKAIKEAEKLATMDAKQKAEYEKEQMQKELDEYKRKDALASMTNTARNMLADANISVSDELLSVMVTTDADETKAAIDAFKEAFNSAVEKAVKEKLKGEPPTKGGTPNIAPTLTKEQIMAIKDPELRQKRMLENKELFNF